MSKDSENLKSLKSSYKEGLVSALVGAGFTKNMYDKAVGWWQLLKGIVVEVYEPELKQQYQYYKNGTKFWQRVKSFDECLDGFVDVIIKRDGYLKVVSNYILHKGVREAIDVYIEEHNPYFLPTKYGTKVSGDESLFISDDKLETHKMFLERNWQHIFTTNYDNALEYVSDRFSLGYFIIKHGYDLSNKKLNRSIIKIHGSLVDREKSMKEKFEFDNDNSLRYIISEEDYLTYPKRHQAFSYLLRIAMLSGTYCLIGFSGDDPNFLSWLDWVKDVLDKGDDKDGIKVFLITVDGKPISKEKELFYRNHHVGVVNLRDDDVRVLWETEGFIKENTSTPSSSDLLQTFFRYLADGEILGEIEETGDGLLYSQLWKNVYFKITERKGESFANELVKIEKSQSEHIFNKYVYFQNLVFGRITEERDVLTEETKRALLLALQDICKPLHEIPREIQNQLESEPLWLDYIKKQETLVARHELLPLDTDEHIFQNVLRHLYHLDFKSAESVLKSWNPIEEIWKCRKASLNYYFDKDRELRILESIEVNSKTRAISYFASTLYRYLSFKLEPNIKYKGLEGIPELISYYVSQLRQSRSGVERSGAEEHLSTYFERVMQSPQKGYQLFKFLTDNGLATSYSIVNVINSVDWYLTFCVLYENYPWACLYYSAQYGDRKVLTRIGQDYSYSVSLAPELPKIIRRVLEVMINEDVPVFIRKGLLHICSHMFIAVKENEYYDLFRQYLQSINFSKKGDRIYFDETIAFIACALNSLKSENHISEMITSLLCHYKENESDVMELVVDHLRWKNLRLLTQAQKDLFFDCFENGELRNSIFLLLRLMENSLLTKVEVQKCIKRSLNDKNALRSLPMYQLVCFCKLVKDDKKAVKKLKSEILEREPWGSKYRHGVGGEEDFFRFSMLPPEYVFTDAETRAISVKLQEIFNCFKNLNERGHIVYRLAYEDILEEMDIYIHEHEEYFDVEFRKDFHSKMVSVKGYASWHEAFFGDCSEVIERCINEIYERWKRIAYSDIEECYSIALNRLLVRNTISNTELLEFLARTSRKFDKEIMQSSRIARQLSLLLRHYAKKDLRIYDFEVVRATQAFRTIARLIRENGGNDDFIIWWLDDEQNKRYNYINE